MAGDTTSKSASPIGARDFPETILVGRVLRPHGIRGSLKVQVHSDVGGRFDVGNELLMESPGAPQRTVRIRQVREVRGGLLIDLEGITDRDQAEACRGAELKVDHSQVPPAPEGLFYFFELVGCRCFDADLGELGEVIDLVEDGGGLLLEVLHAGKKLLVPFADAFVGEVDVENGRIDLCLPPGLIEICASRS